eukprot:scaffold300_cov258-Pinguiococcus_pyrenoidosus.AAC.39
MVWPSYWYRTEPTGSPNLALAARQRIAAAVELQKLLGRQPPLMLLRRPLVGAVQQLNAMPSMRKQRCQVELLSHARGGAGHGKREDEASHRSSSSEGRGGGRDDGDRSCDVAPVVPGANSSSFEGRRGGPTFGLPDACNERAMN